MWAVHLLLGAGLVDAVEDLADLGALADQSGAGLVEVFAPRGMCPGRSLLPQK